MASSSALEIRGIDAGYGAVRVLEDVTLTVPAGETVVLLGTNGNGKSTLMKCVMGIVRPRAGRIVVEIDGEKHDLVGRSTEQIVDLGIALVPEGRRLFPRLTVEENLLLGAFRRKARATLKSNLDFCFECFPRLAERRHQLAGQPRLLRALLGDVDVPPAGEAVLEVPGGLAVADQDEGRHARSCAFAASLASAPREATCPRPHRR